MRDLRGLHLASSGESIAIQSEIRLRLSLLFHEPGHLEALQQTPVGARHAGERLCCRPQHGEQSGLPNSDSGLRPGPLAFRCAMKSSFLPCSSPCENPSRFIRIARPSKELGLLSRRSESAGQVRRRRPRRRSLPMLVLSSKRSLWHRCSSSIGSLSLQR